MAAITDGSPGSTGSLPWLLQLYPESWRTRYGGEFAELLLARPPSGRDHVDILRGAFDARLHPQVVSEPERRVAEAADRWLALAGSAAGALFLVWGGLIAFASPRWGAGFGSEDLAAVAYGAGFVGSLIGILVLVALAHRYVDELGSVGTLGAIVVALGMFLMLGNGGPVVVTLMAGGTLAMAPALARRVVPPPVALLFVGAILAVAAGMLGFVGSQGQDTLWLWLVTAYGPAWVLLGFSLRRGRPASGVVTAGVA